MLLGHGSTFLSLPRRRQPRLLSPYIAKPTPPPQRHRKCQNTRVVKIHPRISTPLRHPSNTVPPGAGGDNPRGPHAAGSWLKSATTPPASPERASALPGDVGNDWAHICARFQRRRPPGSPMGHPGEFQGSRRRRSGRNTGAARIFCARSVGNSFICIVIVLYTQYHFIV